MNISVNCPSWHRPRVETLDYLPFCQVWVAPDEYDEYKAKNPNGNIIRCKEGVQGNLCRVRNYILDKEFERGMDAVLIIDDDLQGIYTYSGPKEGPFKAELVSSEEFMLFLDRYSNLCNDLGFKMWGLNCNSDMKCYKQFAPFGFTRYLGGPFQCFLNNPLRYDERLPLKEDYDMTLQQTNKYRGVLRLNFAHYVCRQSTNAGGCATYRNRKREQDQFELLQRKWGEKIVKRDKLTLGKKNVIYADYNPILKIPIKGV